MMERKIPHEKYVWLQGHQGDVNLLMGMLRECEGGVEGEGKVVERLKAEVEILKEGVEELKEEFEVREATAQAALAAKLDHFAIESDCMRWRLTKTAYLKESKIAKR